MNMTSKELIAAMDHIGCSGMQMARWLGVTSVTISNWRAGKHPIPGPAALAITALKTGWRP